MKLKFKTLNDGAKKLAAAELVVLKKRGKNVYNKMREVTELCKNQKTK